MAGIDETLNFIPIRLAILTISDRRTRADDTSGDVLIERIVQAGHEIAAREIVKDDIASILKIIEVWIDDPLIDVIITTGGTGITGRDVTPEALAKVIEKDIPGFGECFRWLSYRSIGTSTIQSRACAGVAKGTFIFALPGSPSACRDGWDEILKYQLDSRYRPCNFIELIPRLKEK
ncbi:MAG: molybdenum cofactor biosynthesis protein B [Alphaproteobacteria bacterium]